MIIFVGLFIVLSYVITMSIINKNIPNSVSQLYYDGGGTWSILVLIVSSFLITIGLLDLTPDPNYQILAFITGAGMAFVGASPNFRANFEDKVHYAGAGCLLVGSQLWLLLFSNPLVFMLWIPAIYWAFTKRRVFWCEITCLFTVLLGLLI